ncbi:MAG TPA: hypothetical protein PLQ95_06455 [Thiobacillus sp.]|nr:hypothetical protein [Thiobacillus sp.]
MLTSVPMVAGCSSQQYDPNYWHQNFIVGLQNNVGKKFWSVRKGETGGWAFDRNLIDRTDLPNGHIAYKYRGQGTCRHTFEVDPKTDVIVVASWEGEARHCAIVP